MKRGGCSAALEVSPELLLHLIAGRESNDDPLTPRSRQIVRSRSSPSIPAEPPLRCTPADCCEPGRSMCNGHISGYTDHLECLLDPLLNDAVTPHDAQLILLRRGRTLLP